MMDDLVTWLRARLDEDERAARKAGSDRWVAVGLAFVDDSKDHQIVRDESMSSGVQAHVARHDPARVLAEVEAKRRILDAYADAVRLYGIGEDPDDDAKWDWLFRSEALEGAARLLALPYADQRGYREEWRP